MDDLTAQLFIWLSFSYICWPCYNIVDSSFSNINIVLITFLTHLSFLEHGMTVNLRHSYGRHLNQPTKHHHYSLHCYIEIDVYPIIRSNSKTGGWVRLIGQISEPNLLKIILNPTQSDPYLFLYFSTQL